MDKFEIVVDELLRNPKIWLITGVAGFIGSNLLEALLKLNQKVVGLDNFSTGFQSNLDEVQSFVGADQWANFQLIEGDICNIKDCRTAMMWHPGPNSAVDLKALSVQYVLHQAALGSVPRSIEDPIATNRSNIDGFLNMLVASRDTGVDQFVYAASSSTYGDHPDLPKVEGKIGSPLSPYAVTKLVNELYAEVFSKTYQFNSIGLRYFNVFGKRQNPSGAYAAVIPKWISAMIGGMPVNINGDGETSRDFCYIQNVVQINILAAISAFPNSGSQIFNVAVGNTTSLNKLHVLLKEILSGKYGLQIDSPPIYKEFRNGDVRHSLADISKAKQFLGYAPQFTVARGLEDAMNWYIENAKK